MNLESALTSFSEALYGPDSAAWRRAIEDEWSPLKTIVLGNMSIFQQIQQ